MDEKEYEKALEERELVLQNEHLKFFPLSDDEMVELKKEERI